jgi:hypothetical protein
MSEDFNSGESEGEDTAESPGGQERPEDGTEQAMDEGEGDFMGTDDGYGETGGSEEAPADDAKPAERGEAAAFDGSATFTSENFSGF